MEEFFESIARAFAQNRGTAPAVQVAILVLLVVLLGLQLAGMARRARARRSVLRNLAAQRGIGEEDLRYAVRLASQAEVDPLSLLTHLDLFERATARALGQGAAGPPPGPGPEDEPAARIRRLRQALGFDRLPVHAPLLSTRELAPGTAVEVGAQHGQTFGIDEGSFSVELPGPVAASAGQEVELGLAHAREARYALRCRVLASRAARSGAWHLQLAHDEAPRRIQLREYVRVPVKGAVVIHPVKPGLALPGLVDDVWGELVDVSGGGAAVASRTELPVGLLVKTSFALGGTRFTGLRAVVLSSSPGPGGQHLAHVEFSALPEPERERLVAAVTRLQLPPANEPPRRA